MGRLQAAAILGLAFAGGRAELFINKLTSMSASDFMMHAFNTAGGITTSQSLVYATHY